MPVITPKLLAAAVLALLVSLLGNVLLARAYLSQRDAATAARASVGEMTQQRDGARDLAAACSDAVDDLRELADRRKKEGEAVRASAAAQARTHEQRADEIMAEPPAVSGDACASAQHRVDSWLQGRAQK
ncbi:hypothetical protein I6G66_05850 [Delftia acidovorans]|uniref:DUF2570 domain-containing protein n=1 Tax=Delftia acidovorans TaxID=80866 RepID=A0A7T2S619_DELAC|nr:hypothetical protein [Delftia acidovorans]QPS09544.1 hypothetical protein I6G66_05850 [Delftia acidovorans]